MKQFSQLGSCGVTTAYNLIQNLNDVLLVDIRTPKQYKSGYIDFSANIPEIVTDDTVVYLDHDDPQGMSTIEGCRAWSGAIGTGFVSGFMYGLFGIGGPPWMIVSVYIFHMCTMRVQVSWNLYTCTSHKYIIIYVTHT